MTCNKCKFYLCVDLPYCQKSVYQQASPLAVSEIRIGLAGGCNKAEARKGDDNE